MEKHTFIPITLMLLLFGAAAQAVGEWPKIYDSASHKWSDSVNLKEAMAQSKIVFVGELHNHEWGHRVELTLLEMFFAVHPSTAVAFEMFERDIQHLMDGYLAGEVGEEFFLRHSRPWKNYEPDYRPLVQFARSYRLPVLAMNVPRRYAAYVATGKESVLWQLPSLEKGFMAAQVLAPEGKYKDKFYKTMEGHVPPEAIERYYRAQCFKDDTMAKSVVEFFKAKPQGHVISYTGSFHSDEHLGLVEKVALQIPDMKRLVLSIIPVTEGTTPDPKQYSHLGDFILFAPANPEREQSPEGEWESKPELLSFYQIWLWLILAEKEE